MLSVGGETCHSRHIYERMVQNNHTRLNDPCGTLIFQRQTKANYNAAGVWAD